MGVNRRLIDQREEGLKKEKIRHDISVKYK